MTFEEDAMDAAYKSLERTEKFCDTSKKFSDFFSSNTQAQKLTPHQRLYRKSIIADCLLFEAILVFIRQSLTSYVKGGYLIRKAWKLYEKIFNETEQLCSQPSPISRPGMTSPTDKHVGSSLYDDKGSFLVEEGKEVEEENEEQFIAALGDTFAMQLGFGVGCSEEGEGGGERTELRGGEREEGGGGEEEVVVQNGSGSSSSSLSQSEITGSAKMPAVPGNYMYTLANYYTTVSDVLYRDLLVYSPRSLSYVKGYATSASHIKAFVVLVYIHVHTLLTHTI